MIIGLCLAYLALKFMFPIGLVGSWRSIATGLTAAEAAKLPASERVRTRWQETLSITKWNALAIAIFVAAIAGGVFTLNRMYPEPVEAVVPAEQTVAADGGSTHVQPLAAQLAAETSNANHSQHSEDDWSKLSNAQKWQYYTSARNAFLVPSLMAAAVLAGLILLFPLGIFAVEAVQDRLVKAKFIEKILIYLTLTLALAALVAALIVAALGVGKLGRLAIPESKSSYVPPEVIKTTSTVYVDRYPAQFSCYGDSVTEEVNGVKVVAWQLGSTGTLDLPKDLQSCRIKLPRVSGGALPYNLLLSLARLRTKAGKPSRSAKSSALPTGSRRPKDFSRTMIVLRSMSLTLATTLRVKPPQMVASQVRSAHWSSSPVVRLPSPMSSRKLKPL